MLAGCSQHSLRSSVSCSDVTKPYNSSRVDCQVPLGSVEKAPAARSGKAATANSKKPRAIGSRKKTMDREERQAPARLRKASLAPLFATTTSMAEETDEPAAQAPVQSYGDLPSILRHTLRDNPDIGIAWAREKDERTAIEIARSALHPTVNIRAAFGPENSNTESAENLAVPRQEFGIDLRQTIYDFGRARGNIDRRKALYNSAAYRRIDEMNKVALEVSQAYLSILEDGEHIAIARRNVASHEEILHLVSESRKAGNATLADVKRVTTRLEKAKTNLIDLRSRKQRSREEFIRLTGLRPENLAPPPRLGAPLPPRGASSSNYPDNPALLSVRADIDSLRAQARTARANMEPTIDLDVSGNVKRNVGGETGLSHGFKGMLSFNYKLLDGDKRLNIARQIQIRILENKHRYRKKRRDYIQSLENAIRTVRANLKKKSLLATRTRDSAKVLNLYKAQFRDGSKTVFELLDAQMDLFSTSSEKIANHYGTLRSIYEIYSLRGDLVARLLRN